MECQWRKLHPFGATCTHASVMKVAIQDVEYHLCLLHLNQQLRVKKPWMGRKHVNDGRRHAVDRSSSTVEGAP